MAHSLDVLKFYEQDVKPAIEKNSNEYIQNLIKTLKSLLERKVPKRDFLLYNSEYVNVLL